ncbi:hypothetical protein QW060_10090 [Myroides ceti]|uniref:Uncharacterized protein n=1 Tax=Paenimyroides ceti TaxID=395087 RepID=A0ABT8CSV0_9FLAO|nr:hypothetical protein [Paenimyroides ceti]MDN3707480.1 hypothetical protein [Paenimyroides ceti]
MHFLIVIIRCFQDVFQSKINQSVQFSIQMAVLKEQYGNVLSDVVYTKNKTVTDF